VNGQPVRFLVDNIVPYSTISLENALKLHLKMEGRPSDITGNRASGGEDAGVATVKEFSLAGLAGGRVIKDAEFMVLARKFDPNFIGMIGRDIIGSADAEYDLAKGIIRLLSSTHCSGQSLAYWHGPADVSEIELEFKSGLEVGKLDIPTSALTGMATINGKKIRVLFSTGASCSMLSPKAAKRLGIKPEGETVVAAGVVLPINEANVDAHIARLDSLNLGAESHKDVQVLVGDLKDYPFVDLLLGADFFLSHRIYIASNPHSVFFTYSGGRLFNLTPFR
jgi:predicted aspartyl protease